MYDLYKNFILLSKNLFFFQINLFIQNKYLYPLSKNLILLKTFSLSKKIHSVSTHSFNLVLQQMNRFKW